MERLRLFRWLPRSRVEAKPLDAPRPAAGAACNAAKLKPGVGWKTAKRFPPAASGLSGRLVDKAAPLSTLLAGDLRRAWPGRMANRHPVGGRWPAGHRLGVTLAHALPPRLLRGAFSLFLLLCAALLGFEG